MIVSKEFKVTLTSNEIEYILKDYVRQVKGVETQLITFKIGVNESGSVLEGTLQGALLTGREDSLDVEKDNKYDPIAEAAKLAEMLRSRLE